jgi:hypothetical protein
MFTRKSNKVIQQRQSINVGKIEAEIVLKDGKVFKVAEYGHYFWDGVYRPADSNLFFERREKAGYIMIEHNHWIPRENVEAIHLVWLDHLI